MTALCVFTLEDWLIKRLCANFRHSVCNRARRGTGNDLIGRNEVLARHARTIAGGDARFKAIRARTQCRNQSIAYKRRGLRRTRAAATGRTYERHTYH